MRPAIAIFIFFHLSAYTQSYNTIRNAEKHLSKGNFRCAVKSFKEAVENDPENEYLHYRLGYSYFMLNEFEDAIQHYEASKSTMKDSMKYHFELYHLYSAAGYSSFAKEAFIRYVHLCPSCVREDLIPGSKSNKLMYRKPTREPNLMGYESDKGEYYPYIINDDQIQHFNVKADKTIPSHANRYKKYLTRYYSNKDFKFYRDHSYKQINKLSGKLYGPFTLNKEQSRIYITRWNKAQNRLFIYYSDRESQKDLAWKQYQGLIIDGDDGTKNYIHPMLTKDEKHLMFASDREGGIGGYDIWIGEITDELLIKNVKNLGGVVNTPGDEVYPSTHEEDVLFFASDGHYGFGGLDLYAAVGHQKISETYNLGNRFNSAYDDYSLFYNVKKNIGFFSSNRYHNMKDSQTFDRIYSQTFDKVNTSVDVLDHRNRGIAGLQVEVPKEKTKTTTKENGRAEFSISPLGTRHIHVYGNEKYQRIDTFIPPFETRINLRIEKKEAKDVLPISLVSHPHEYPAGNTFFILTSQHDQQRYCGTTDASGIGEVKLYEDELYDLEVPSYQYTKKGVKLGGFKMPVFQVYSDLPKNTPTKRITSQSDKEETVALTDNFNIYYESGNWMMTESLNKQIQHIVGLLNQNPGYKMELISHTDCQGEAKANLELSRQRLEEAKRFFFSRGVSDKQMVGKYMGETQPANGCSCDRMDNYNCPGDLMRLNRRTEVRLLK